MGILLFYRCFIVQLLYMLPYTFQTWRKKLPLFLAQAIPQGSVVYFNLETKEIIVLQGLFTPLEVTKEQLDDYKKHYIEIQKKKKPILDDFQTLKKETFTSY